MRRYIIQRHSQTHTALTTLVTEQGFVLQLAQETALHGWALAMRGQSKAGIAQIRQGLTAVLATGDNACAPYFLGLLAAAYGEGGHPEEALQVLATESRWYQAELYHLEEALLLRQAVPDASQVEACFQQAPTIARRYEPESPVSCLRRSTAGSPKALTPLTCRRLRAAGGTCITHAVKHGISTCCSMSLLLVFCVSVHCRSH